MHNPASVQENGTHKLPRDFDIQTDHLVSARRLDLIIINKKRKLAKLRSLLYRLTTEKKLKESEQNDKYLNYTKVLKKNYGT